MYVIIFVIFILRKTIQNTNLNISHSVKTFIIIN